MVREALVVLPDEGCRGEPGYVTKLYNKFKLNQMVDTFPKLAA